jgi:hypothetical protein
MLIYMKATCLASLTRNPDFRSHESLTILQIRSALQSLPIPPISSITQRYFTRSSLARSAHSTHRLITSSTFLTPSLLASTSNHS